MYTAMPGKKTIVISGFPETGKTFFSSNYKRLGYDNLVVQDADSSLFSWIDGIQGGTRNSLFPINYINYIKACIGIVDIVFVSSHKAIRDKLKEAGITYYLVYPSEILKKEYINRYEKRGNTPEFISKLDENFNSFIEECDEDTIPQFLKYKLTSSSCTMTDVIDDIVDILGVHK